jgi:hypothetical protein
MTLAIEGDGVVTGQFHFFGGANGSEFRFDLVGINAFRRLTGESKQDGAVGAMSQTSERQRAIKIDTQRCSLICQAG